MNLGDKYAEYSEIVSKSLTWDWVLLGILIVLALGVIGFFIWWRMDINQDTKYAFNEKLLAEAKTDNLKWYIFAGILSILLSLALTSTVKDIHEAKQDIKNEAYVIIDSPFTVSEQEWWGRWNRTTYSINFEKDGSPAEISPDLRDIDLPSGHHTDKVLVYAEKSEIIVDIFLKE